MPSGHRSTTEPKVQARPAQNRTNRRVSLSGAFEHPADRTKRRRRRRPDRPRRSPYDRFAERTSFLASSALFFVVCASLVLSWAGGFAFGASALGAGEYSLQRILGGDRD